MHRWTHGIAVSDKLHAGRIWLQTAFDHATHSHICHARNARLYSGTPEMCHSIPRCSADRCRCHCSSTDMCRCCMLPRAEAPRTLASPSAQEQPHCSGQITRNAMSESLPRRRSLRRAAACCASSAYAYPAESADCACGCWRNSDRDRDSVPSLSSWGSLPTHPASLALLPAPLIAPQPRHRCPIRAVAVVSRCKQKQK
jgi:hypothetical protein